MNSLFFITSKIPMWPKYGVADATPATPLTPSLDNVNSEKAELWRQNCSMSFRSERKCLLSMEPKMRKWGNFNQSYYHNYRVIFDTCAMWSEACVLKDCIKNYSILKIVGSFKSTYFGTLCSDGSIVVQCYVNVYIANWKWKFENTWHSLLFSLMKNSKIWWKCKLEVRQILSLKIVLL